MRGKLKNPFLLAGQGFALGAFLFFVVQHGAGEARFADEAPPSSPSSFQIGR